MKEQSWNNEAFHFIIFKVIMEIPPWKIIKDPISAKKGSITSKNSEVFLRNLTHSQKPSYRRLGLDWIAAKTKPFLTISILKFSFLSSFMFILLFEDMLPKSNPYGNIRIASFFWIGNIFLVLLSTYLENTGKNSILCVKGTLMQIWKSFYMF